VLLECARLEQCYEVKAWRSERGMTTDDFIAEVTGLREISLRQYTRHASSWIVYLTVEFRIERGGSNGRMMEGGPSAVGRRDWGEVIRAACVALQRTLNISHPVAKARNETVSIMTKSTTVQRCGEHEASCRQNHFITNEQSPARPSTVSGPTVIQRLSVGYVHVLKHLDRPIIFTCILKSQVPGNLRVWWSGIPPTAG
jgi:hypothetical protein